MRKDAKKISTKRTKQAKKAEVKGLPVRTSVTVKGGAKVSEISVTKQSDVSSQPLF